MSREGTWVPPIDPLLSFVMFMVIIKLLLLLVFITRIKLNCIWSLAKRTFPQKLVYVLTTLFFFIKKHSTCMSIFLAMVPVKICTDTIPKACFVRFTLNQTYTYKKLKMWLSLGSRGDLHSGLVNMTWILYVTCQTSLKKTPLRPDNVPTSDSSVNYKIILLAGSTVCLW